MKEKYSLFEDLIGGDSSHINMPKDLAAICTHASELVPVHPIQSAQQCLLGTLRADIAFVRAILGDLDELQGRLLVKTDCAFANFRLCAPFSVCWSS